MSAEKDLLVVVLETHDKAWKDLEVAAQVKNDALNAQEYILQLCTFLTTYQLLSDANRLAVVASHNHTAPCLFSDLDLLVNPESANQGGRAAAEAVTLELSRILQAAADQPLPSAGRAGGCMSAALSRALCMISRVTSGAPASTVARRRVLVVQASPDVPGQYIACMNAIFSAQRLNVTIDAISIGTHTSAFIEQAAHLTNGIYLNVRKTVGLLQYLTMCFTVNTETRRCLELPKSRGIDFQATCFCHSKVINIGFVCSVCLSVFCCPQRSCMTCGTDFSKAAKTA